MHLCTAPHAVSERERLSLTYEYMHTVCGVGVLAVGGRQATPAPAPAAVAATACCSLVGFRSKFSIWLATSQGFLYTFSIHTQHTHAHASTLALMHEHRNACCTRKPFDKYIKIFPTYLSCFFHEIMQNLKTELLVVNFPDAWVGGLI